MGVAIYLRQQVAINRFRDLLISAISSGLGDNIILCSGFFQEDDTSKPPKTPYRASTEKDFAIELAKHAVKVYCIGVHNSGWTKRFSRFIAALKAQKITVIHTPVSGLKWHAKVFIYRNGDEPILGIIGSSNITRPAFSDTSPFNYEADVVLWEDGHPINSVVKQMLPPLPGNEEKDNMWHDVIVSGYSVHDNGNLTIKERLVSLANKIMEIKTSEKKLEETDD